MYKLGDLANFINAQLIGDASSKVNSIAALDDAKKNQLTYIVDAKYKPALISSNAGVVILTQDLLNDCPTNALVVDNVYLAFAQISHYFKVHIDETVSDNCTIAKTAHIGNNCAIGANCVIGQKVVIGDNVVIHPNVTLLQGTVIGNNVVLAAGVVIGSEGFGNALDSKKHWHSIAHLGNVIIGDNVTIGANSVIDRGTIKDTQIRNGVRLDNLVHIAHNVMIGAHTAIAAGVTVGGSTTLGKYCQIGGGAVIASHMRLDDNTTVTGSSTVDKHLNSGHYTGFTSISPHSNWKRTQFWLLKLDKIVQHLNIKLKNLKG